MFLKKLINVFRSLSARLTLWYSGIFTISSVLVFIFFYVFITTFIFEQTDSDLLKQSDTISRIFSIQGISTVKRFAEREVQAAGDKKIFIRLLYPNGGVFSSSNMSYWKNIDIHKDTIRKLTGNANIIFETIIVPDQESNIRVLYSALGSGFILQYGRSMEDYARILDAFNGIFFYVLFFPIFFASLVGWFMARKALSGIGDVTKTAGAIAEGAIEKRVPVRAVGDEIDKLAITFNRMLDKIQGLIAGIKEISDNVAHDLKSPVTRIRGEAEITLTTATTMLEYQDMAGNTIEECDNLIDMINTMLVISKTEAGAGRLEFLTLDFSEIIKKACDLFKPFAEDKDINLIHEIPDKCMFKGDLRLLQRMISNLIDNAIKYTDKGFVHVYLKRERTGEIRISVKDSGIGISEEHIPHIFNRFYRCDPSRTDSGSGLGLCLVDTIVTAHGGSLDVRSDADEGSEFILKFNQSAG